LYKKAKICFSAEPITKIFNLVKFIVNLDEVFDEKASNSSIFNTTYAQMIEHNFKGFNCNYLVN